MAVSEDEVRHIAALSRLQISDDRMPALARELTDILGHMDVLQSFGDASAESEGAATSSPLREDVPGAVALTRSLDEFAPASRDGFFLVPRLSTHE